ncbi:hypothetical protein R1sor_004391 [Riccia sorocarpa]|uniref:Uncharacterized protein n=1 Tax=Riccia sorocarpa TaxID=122646 RepID=A0ABD3HKW3_9MARC
MRGQVIVTAACNQAYYIGSYCAAQVVDCTGKDGFTTKQNLANRWWIPYQACRYCIRLSVARLTGIGGRLGNWDFISFPYADTGMEIYWHWKLRKRDRGFLFGPSDVGVPPPHPELHDVMLACHADECGSSVLDYCVVRMVFAREDEANASQLLAGTENLLEDIADITDQTSAEQAGGEVQVQCICQNGTGSWVMRPGACGSTIPFRHLRKLCDNFTVVAYTGDKSCQWIGG